MNRLTVHQNAVQVFSLIGDTQPGVTNKITYTAMPFYKADDQLLPSGLLGPIKIISTTQ